MKTLKRCHFEKKNPMFNLENKFWRLKMRKIIWIFMALVMCVACLSACGSESEDENNVEADEYAYLKELVDGCYYIRHSDNTVEEVYFGAATFEEEDTTYNASSGRIMWFKEDFDNIPTLYAGESLILYTNAEFDEEMLFERFEDMGYTIGICNMDILESGRLSISTEIDNLCTYPGSDADEILNLENENVILDTLGGKKIRVEQSSTVSDDEIVTRTWTDSVLSRCGTINNLVRGSVYKVEIYNGTVRHEFNLATDIRVLSSMEAWKSYDYNFESETIINISIPEYFNSGYYMINGLGMFRYVKEINTSTQEGYEKASAMDYIEFWPNADYASYITFDTANIDPNAEKEDEIITGNKAENNVVYEPSNGVSYIPGMDENTFSSSNLINIPEIGNVTVTVTYKVSGYGEGLPEPTAIITTPSGSKNMEMGYDDAGGTSTLTFKAEEIGNYAITYYNLEDRIPHVNVTIE